MKIFFTVLFIILSVLTFVFPLRTVLSQDEKSEYDKAYETYRTDIEAYEKANNEYIFRRSQYLNFKTLKSQQDAHAATLTMLQARDQVLVSYIEVLEKRLTEAIGVPQARREGLMIRLNEEKTWFADHKNDISSAGTLDDLVRESTVASNHYNSILTLFYEVLGVVAQGKVYDYTDRTDELYNRVYELVEKIRNEDRDEYRFSAEKQQNLDRWLFEAQSRINRSKEKQTEADAAVLNFIRRRSGIVAAYNSLISGLGESQLLLKESNTFLLEIMHEVKTAE